MTDSNSIPDAQELFERLKQHLYSGEQPAIDVTTLNVMAALQDDDHPAAFVCSFVGRDINDESNEPQRALHVILDGIQVARLVEQLTAAAAAEMRYAITGEATEVDLDGRTTFRKREDPR